MPHANMPLDEVFVDSLLFEAVLECKEQASRFFNEILGYLQGNLPQDFEPYTISELHTELLELWGMGLYPNLVNMLKLIYGCNSARSIRTKRSMALISTVLREMLIQVEPDKGPHHEPFELH